MSPDHPEALIGRIKALSLLGRAKEAFAAIDAVLATEGRVFPGEVFYWRAWNFTQIQDLDMAWTAIEQANRLWVNSEVSKLGGIIAYRRLQRPAAIERFTAAQKLAPDDCENSYYLGIVYAEQRDWPATKNVFDGAASCLDAARAGLRKEIATIEASNWDPARKVRQMNGGRRKSPPRRACWRPPGSTWRSRTSISAAETRLANTPSASPATSNLPSAPGIS